jgi:hypothetical protein
MADWTMMIHGGFAMVFPENDANATIGPIRKPATGYPDYLRHEMVLRIPKATLRDASLPSRDENGFLAFVLEDKVELLPDGQPENAAGLSRVKTNNPKPGDWNDFYYVWDANRFKDADDPKGVVRDDWRDQLVAHLEIRNGRLVVQEPYFTTQYEIERKKGKAKKLRRSLATHILYTPKSAAEFVTFRTRAGSVTASAANYDLSADCDCPSHQQEAPPANQDMPGFGVTFTMYKGANKDHLEFIPRFLGNPNPKAAVNPGADCSPREYSI